MVNPNSEVVKFLVFVSFACLTAVDDVAARRRNIFDKPNIVWIVADDLGYGDLSSYGHPVQEYGRVDELARDGLRFTQAYVPDSVCTPSRAAFLTGRYPARLGIYGHKLRVFLPFNPSGMNRSEITIAEALRDAGYTTGMVGKWHLGNNKPPNMDGYYLPSNQGFDYVGTMLPNTDSFYCEETLTEPNTDFCFLYRGTDIIQQPIRHDNLTQRMVDDAVEFLEKNRKRPFLLYMALLQPHVPLRVSPRFHRSSKRGRIGDNINEMSWAVGEVMDALKRLRIRRNTLVIFHSDHGPQAEFCAEGGVTGTLRGYKSNTWEGGVRVPFIAYWPGVIRPGISREVISSLDLFPTFVDLANGSLPTDRVYDGLNIRDVLLGVNGSNSPHDALLFYCADRLMAVRYGDYKLHFHTKRLRSAEFFAATRCGNGGAPKRVFHHDCGKCRGECVTDHDPPLVFDVEKDPTELYALNVTEPEIQAVIDAVADLVEAHKRTMTIAPPLCDMKDPSVIPCCNPPDCRCNYTPPPSDWDY